MPQNPETLEAAREMLLENNNTIEQLTQQRDTLSQEITELRQRVEELRNHNQYLFNQIPQKTIEPEKDPEPEPEPETLEQFAKKIKGVI